MGLNGAWKENKFYCLLYNENLEANQAFIVTFDWNTKKWSPILKYYNVNILQVRNLFVCNDEDLVVMTSIKTTHNLIDHTQNERFKITLFPTKYFNRFINNSQFFRDLQTLWKLTVLTAIRYNLSLKFFGQQINLIGRDDF